MFSSIYFLIKIWFYIYVELKVLTIGRVLHFPVLAQSLIFQAWAPWPSKMAPCPFKLKFSSFSKLIHPQWGLPGVALEGAIIWPSISKVTALLHGPLNSKVFTKYLPFRTLILLGDFDSHAFFHASANAYITSVPHHILT